MHLWLQITLRWNARFTKAWWNHPPNLNTTRTSQQPARGFIRKTRLLKSLATMQHKLAKPCKMHLWLQITLSWNAHSTTTWWNRPRTVNKARNLETACQIYQWQTLPSLRISSLADSTSWRLKGPAVFFFFFTSKYCHTFELLSNERQILQKKKKIEFRREKCLAYLTVKQF